MNTPLRRSGMARILKGSHSFICKCKCRFIERDYITPLMRYRLECPANRYVFKSRLNCSESTAGSLRQSGSEFQTVGPATEKARVPKGCAVLPNAMNHTCLFLPSQSWSSFTDPGRMEGWVGLGYYWVGLTSISLDCFSHSLKTYLYKR